MLETVAFYKDYMVNFNQDNQKGKTNEKAKNSKKHGGALENDPNAGRKKKKVSGKHSRTGKFLYGLRRRKGKPENVERVSEDTTEEYSSTTRFLESSLGIKSYAELAPYLAKGVERVMAEIIDCKPTELIITPELICKLHKDAFGGLFPSWAGRYRDRDVVVGKYNPPHYFEVPVLIKQYCEDLEYRLSLVGPKPPLSDILLETLAFAEGRFLNIHPFLDFNGRVARMLLFTLLYRLNLPPVQLVPDEKDRQGRTEYLAALSSADNLDLQPLISVWKRRLDKEIK